MGLVQSKHIPLDYEIIHAHSWFETYIGVNESQWMEKRSESIQVGNPIRSIKFGQPLRIRSMTADNDERVYDCGAFSVWSLRDLQNEISHLEMKATADENTEIECIFEILIRDCHEYLG